MYYECVTSLISREPKTLHSCWRNVVEITCTRRNDFDNYQVLPKVHVGRYLSGIDLSDITKTLRDTASRDRGRVMGLYLA